MALIPNALLSIGTIRAGTSTRVGGAISNTSAINSTDVVSTASATFQVGHFTYVRQDVANSAAIQGTQSYAQTNHPSGTASAAYGAVGIAEARGTGATGAIRGGSFLARSSGAGNVSIAYSVVAETIERTGAGVITEAGGLLVQSQTVGGTNYAIKTEGSAPVLFSGTLRTAGSTSIGHLNLPLTTLDVRGANAGEGATAAAGGSMWVGNTTGGMIITMGTQESPNIHGFIQARMRANANYERLVLQPSGGALLVGTLVVAGAANGDLILKNTGYLRGANVAGTNTLPLIRTTTTDRTEISANNLSLLFSNVVTTSTVGAAGGASALPATPLGYWRIQLAGVEVKIPYYTA